VQDPSDVDDPSAGMNIDLKTVSGVNGPTPFESAIGNARLGSNSGFPGDPNGMTIATGPEFNTFGKALTGENLRSARAIQCTDQGGSNYYAWVPTENRSHWSHSEARALLYWSQEGKLLHVIDNGSDFSMAPSLGASLLNPVDLLAAAGVAKVVGGR